MIDRANERLIGVWRLVSYQDRASVEDEWADTDGVDVDGLIVYDASGWLAIQVAGSDGRYDSYFGRFTIGEATEHDGAVVGVVRHEVLLGHSNATTTLTHYAHVIDEARLGTARPMVAAIIEARQSVRKVCATREPRRLRQSAPRR